MNEEIKKIRQLSRKGVVRNMVLIKETFGERAAQDALHSVKDEETLRLIREAFKKIAEQQVKKKKSSFWAKLHYLLSKKLKEKET